MKKLLLVMFSLSTSLAVVLSACGDDESENSDSPVSQTENTFSGKVIYSGGESPADAVISNTTNGISLSVTDAAQALASFHFDDLSVELPKNDTSYIAAQTETESLRGYLYGRTLYLEITGSDLEDTVYFSTEISGNALADSLRLDSVRGVTERNALIKISGNYAGSAYIGDELSTKGKVKVEVDELGDISIRLKDIDFGGQLFSGNVEMPGMDFNKINDNTYAFSGYKIISAYNNFVQIPLQVSGTYQTTNGTLQFNIQTVVFGQIYSADFIGTKK